MKPFLRQQLERYAQRLEELNFLLSREDIMDMGAGGLLAGRVVVGRQHHRMLVLGGLWNGNATAPARNTNCSISACRRKNAKK